MASYSHEMRIRDLENENIDILEIAKIATDCGFSGAPLKLTWTMLQRFGEAVAEFSANKQKEACARMLELKPDEIRLMAGEMTAAEMRLVQAVLKNRAAVMRGNA